MTASKLCTDSQQPRRAATATLRVMLAFCLSGYQETSVTDRVAGVDDSNDASFRSLIRQMTMQLT